MLSVRLYSGFNSRAIAKGYSGALAYWTLARALDVQGSGRITAAEVKQAALHQVGWSVSKLRRGYLSALSIGLITKGKTHLYITGLLRTARLIGLESLGHLCADVSAKAMRTSGTFRAALWATTQSGRAGMPRRGFSKPISRKVLTHQFAISRRTQARYEKKHNANRIGQIKRRINFQILHGLTSRHLRGARENVHPACFMWGEFVAKPLPNSYQSGLSTCRGRLKKANRSLRSLVCNGAGVNVSEPKVFYGSAAEWSKACRVQQTKPKNIARAFPLSALVGYKFKYSRCGIWVSSDALCLISDHYNKGHK